jgi:NAD(P)-dependent dehydrogenase (short-subunit alcohol dehydrogenase family)
MTKTWFITGASRGFGRIWAEAALKRGDKVTATARAGWKISRTSKSASEKRSCQWPST